MARNQNTFLKVQREMAKKRKAEEKRARRLKKKEEGANGTSELDPADSSATEES